MRQATWILVAFGVLVLAAMPTLASDFDHHGHHGNYGHHGYYGHPGYYGGYGAVVVRPPVVIRTPVVVPVYPPAVVYPPAYGVGSYYYGPQPGYFEYRGPRVSIGIGL